MDIQPFNNYFTFMGHTFSYVLDETKHPYQCLINGNSIQTDLGIFVFHLDMTVNEVKYQNTHDFYKTIFPNWSTI